MISSNRYIYYLSISFHFMTIYIAFEWYSVPNCVIFAYRTEDGHVEQKERRKTRQDGEKQNFHTGHEEVSAYAVWRDKESQRLKVIRRMKAEVDMPYEGCLCGTQNNTRVSVRYMKKTLQTPHRESAIKYI